MADKFIFLVTIICIGTSWAQSDITNLPALDNMTIPPELAGKVDPKDIEKIQNKTLQEFKQKCEKNGGPEAYNKAQNASQVLQQCVTGLIDSEQLKSEIETAKPHGAVDEVFKKYCAKTPQFKYCVKNFTETSKICMSAAEQKHLNTVYSVSDQLAEFICYKDGDRIALFIAEGGRECFQDKQESLSHCFNQTGIQNFSGSTLDVNALSDFSLSFDETQCKQLSDLQTCMVHKLEGCEKPTTANIVESLFKFVRKATPCKMFEDGSKKSSATNLFVAATTLIAATAFTRLI